MGILKPWITYICFETCFRCFFWKPCNCLKIECITEKTYGQWWQSLHRTMLRGVLGKTFRLVGYTIQYGCIAHCAFEYVGGVVMTCWLLCRVELILELPAYYESSSKLEEHLLDFLSFKPAQMIYILKGFQLTFKNCLSFSVLDHQWSLQFKIQILFLQKILVDTFMVSKEVTL
ncbi:mitochondrial inner membrane protease subunit 1 isoform X4 [Physeter macrocephalus]|uniref:Mitochondrial inner membrane protease subunit 1 isoform X4 n=1 Tax=Physeter macrocephalus TaxID=9755 RepID=A0A455C781_PHYMC|nr:mitochondrial inner membrane protease subunit 1 isoform X4 [Physeter catodon]|eukprot:XP_028356927.1 mitochondrial inner membrane protease subunit 1 isoform X4 [Physeter catodon]